MVSIHINHSHEITPVAISPETSDITAPDFVEGIDINFPIKMVRSIKLRLDLMWT
tara:strand:- start:52 stop:216 length:165 start_codon:yes stop_codon:yes gene_type:complete